MQELPDPNSGGLAPLGAPQPRRPLRKSIRVWTVLLLLCSIVIGMAIGGGFWIRSAFRPGHTWDDRLFVLIGSSALFAPLCVGLWSYIRAKWKLGPPLPPRQPSVQKAAPQCSTRGCATNQNSLVSHALKWANCSAFDPSCTPWQRAAAWFVLVAYTLAMLGIAAFGIISLGAAFADGNTITATLLFIAFGLAVLIWPATVARSLIRGLRAGKVGTTREELDELRVQRNAWATRENQKPLCNKIINTALGVGLYALWWMRVTVHHTQHPNESWVTPAMWTPALLYSIWIQFRRAKNTPATTDNSKSMS